MLSLLKTLKEDNEAIFLRTKSMKKRLFFLPLLFTVALVSMLFAGCKQEEEYPTWKLSDTVSASFSDNGKYGYILKIEGSGAIPDYASEHDTPWDGRAGRITSIEFGEGIVSVGDNAFVGCAALDYVILPESITEIGTNAFYSETAIYAYSEVKSDDGAKIYVYSEKQPAQGGDFWHFRNDGTPTVWENIKVLFIGNSFTYYNDLPTLFGQIASGAGEVVEVDWIAHGSYTLEKYADPNDVAAPTEDVTMQGCGKMVDETLRASDDYDVVILQEQSTRPITNYNSFLDAARTLKEKIDETQKDCEVYLYATWGFPAGLDSKYTTIPDLEAAIRQAYKNVASEIGAKVSNVGEAFTAVYNSHSEIGLYNADGRHPSYEGSYLAACVHVATILGCDPRTTTYTGNLSDEVAQLLQGVAYDVVFGS